MVQQTNFWDTFCAEFYKSRKNLGFYILIIFPVFTTSIVFLYYCHHVNNFDPELNHWMNFTRYLFLFYMFIYPMAVSFSAYSVMHIEYKNNAIKHLFTLPVPKPIFYLSKIALLFAVIIFSLLLCYGLLILSGNLLNYFYPQLLFHSYDIRLVLSVLFVKSLFSLLCVALVQLLLCMLFRSFVVSLSFALFFTIFGFVASKWEYAFLNPYSGVLSAFLSFFKQNSLIFQKDTIFAICTTIITLVLGYFIFRKLK